ncbi:MAG: diaminopimelate decarboxylase, partial [Zoogloeaceae bacterium]|nr:diaminopimelate decarboxylase [Zoogloeaceae bacterium]
MSLLSAPFFDYRKGVLHVEDLPLPELAERFGTPLFVYSRAALTHRLREFQTALAAHPAGADALICYAVKANGNLSLLRHFARQGAGFDIVSGGELARVLAAGGDPGKVVFSGVGKTAAEIEAALTADILSFNVESAAELERLSAIASRLGKSAPCSLRVNPDVDPKTHPYIATGLKTAKFGVPIEDAAEFYTRAAALPNLEIVGVDCHIGSQLLDPSPYAAALTRLLALVDDLKARGIALKHIDLGGGLGIRYRPEEREPEVAAYLAPLLAALAGRGL